ncbi:zinc-binding dehydrogenase [Spirillospora sp. NPDC048819]|uniref:zinc-binding dehydrogenase n=1 Tax=Spirillospora sp. NPDC048819 TaxID=3155268 RepID=UPI0033CD1C4A
MTGPAMMRAVVLERRGEPDDMYVRPWPRPAPGAGEVLIAVRTVTTASFDMQARTLPITRLPLVLGQDPAGVVAEIGAGVSRFRVGDRVTVGGFQPCGSCEPCLDGRPFCARHEVLGIQRDGGQAEFVTVPDDLVVPIPDRIGFAEASVMAITYPVAWNLISVNGGLRPGARVLVMAAAGGVGLACVQVARSLGAHVIAAVGAPWKAERLRELLGIDSVVDYSRPDWADDVRRIAGRGGVDLVADNISDPALFEDTLRLLAVGGRLVTCGAHGGGVVSVDIRRLYLNRQSIIGVNIPGRDVVDAAWTAVERGRLPAPPITGEFTLDDLPEVHRLIAARKTVGRTLIRVSDDGPPAGPHPDRSRP